MALEQSTLHGAVSVRRVIAEVRPVSEDERRAFLDQAREDMLDEDPGRFERLSESLLADTRYEIRVRLAIELSDGRVVRSHHETLGIGGHRRGIGAITRRKRGFPWPNFILNRCYRVQPSDIEDAIKQNLGRLPMPFPTSGGEYDGLIQALREQHVDVTRDALNEAPLSLEFTPEAQADLFGTR